MEDLKRQKEELKKDELHKILPSGGGQKGAIKSDKLGEANQYCFFHNSPVNTVI